jgi:hypothetical protein
MTAPGASDRCDRNPAAEAARASSSSDLRRDEDAECLRPVPETLGCPVAHFRGL